MKTIKLPLPDDLYRSLQELAEPEGRPINDLYLEALHILLRRRQHIKLMKGIEEWQSPDISLIDTQIS